MLKIKRQPCGDYETTLPSGHEVTIQDRRKWDDDYRNHPAPWAAYFDGDGDEFRTKREAIEYLNWLVENNERYQA